MEIGPFVADHKITLYAREAKWCGKLHFGTAVRHDPERIRVLVEMDRSETFGELMQLLLSETWMRLCLFNMGKILAPLRAWLERKQRGTTRTKRNASRKVVSDVDLSQAIRRCGSAPSSCWKMWCSSNSR